MASEVLLTRRSLRVRAGPYTVGGVPAGGVDGCGSFSIVVDEAQNLPADCYPLGTERFLHETR